ncbi:hypothetical protein E4U21_004085 [Claviceps maximensis]|nr:hypothetical protein E4U21_004085 [Claviceps maximensis]
MPKAKRLKGSGAGAAAGAAKAGKASNPAPVAETERPTPAEVDEEEHQFVKLARKHWLKPSKKVTRPKVKNDVLKQGIWDVLEQDGFQYKSLLLLESLQTMESLDCAIVRKECAPLVSIGIWQNLCSEKYRESLLDQTSQLRKAWRASQKRYDAADDTVKARLRFERSWLYSLLLDFLGLLYDTTRQGSLRFPIDYDGNLQEHTLYCERFTEFISDLQSQLPTRRYVNTLLQDLNLLPLMRLSPMYNDENNSLLRDLHALLVHYTNFAIDDQTGTQLTATEVYERHCATLGKLQRVALKNFREKLMVLALSNYGGIEKRVELEGLLGPLTDDELTQLFGLLNLRSTYPESFALPVDRKFLIEVLVSKHERKKSFRESARYMPLVPTERSLFDQGFQRADVYDGSHPLALPKLNLQYLSAGDFLWRAMILYRCEAFYGIRKDVESALKRLHPEFLENGLAHL